MDLIYLDNNATTPLRPEVWAAMQPYFSERFGNPASAHTAGQQARRALEDAREQLADLLDASADEVVFTSGATEANNLALFGLAAEPPGHTLVSPIEHPSVEEPIRQLQHRGWAVDRLPVSPQGAVLVESLPSLLRADTRLLTVMLANHEMGAVQPIRELQERLPGTVAFHCDAVQAVGKIPVRFHELGVTSLSLSGHKFHGPKGVGALLLKRDARLRPQLWGGHQQQGRRPGTETVALAVGLAAALDLWQREAAMRTESVRRLRQRLLAQLQGEATPVVLNGPAEDGIPHTLNLSFPGCRADALLMKLDLAGVACSTGSACSSGSLLPSPVLRAMGVPDDLLRSAMRFSLSPMLTEAEVAEAARRIAAAVTRLRATAENDFV